jgi:tetratricopeptide (TPR) repeat protein
MDALSIVPVMSKPGRNDPCPCGSGKKYKKCCLPREEAARAAAPPEEPFIAELRPDLDEAVDRALQRLEQGEGKRVKSEICELLEQNPDYHLTNYAMGVYLVMVDKAPAEAVPFFEKAVAILPPFPEAHFNLANSARGALDIPKAIMAYRAAVRYSQEGDIAEMARNELQRLQDIIVKGTPFPSLDAYLANSKLFDRAFECLCRQEFGQAAELFQRVLSEYPTHVQSHGNLALAYAGLGRRADALASFDRALALDPSYEPALLNRRITLTMREGEPFIADDIMSVEYYADRVRGASHGEGADTAGV